MPLSKQKVFIGDFEERARIAEKNWGRTDLYSTGQPVLDRYFSGGFGRKNGYEIVLMYGQTGVGKSTVALNFMADAIRSGVKVGMLVLEDDMTDVSNRLKHILGDTDYAKMNTTDNVRCLPEDAMNKKWNLPDLIEYIGAWYSDGIDLILLDHLQFAFENAESIKGENEWNAQRIFMQDLNQLMKRVQKTVILISHMNKANGSKGMDRIVGSGSLAQAATKVIEIMDGDVPGTIELQLRKSRFTARPNHGYVMRMRDSKMEPAT
jgi:predicted ATP-dependent serine protease